MGESYRELRNQSIEDLIARYDRLGNVVDSQLFLSQEIARRDSEKQTAEMMDINRQMLKLTKRITFLTVLSFILVIVTTVVSIVNVLLAIKAASN